MRSTLLGVTLAITVLAGALTFAACLDHLLDTPRLYGLVWNAQLTNYGSGPPLAAEAERLRGDPRVDALAVGESGVPATIDGQGTSLAYLDSPDDAALPPAIRGRAPEQDDEIALGARTADEVDASVGDEVTVEIEGLDSAPFRVSGILVLPSGQGSRLGEGGLIARAGTFRLGATEEQLTEDLFVQLADGVDADDVAASLPTEGESGNFAIPLDAPSDVVNFGRVDALPAILGGLLALLAIVTLAHTLVTAAQRRRRELALLKTLGFVAPQIRGAVRWQALTLVSLAIVVGLPTGAFAGRMAWTVLAEQLGVVPEPVTPVLALSLLVPAAVVVALLVAIVPARLAARTRPAAVLRAG